MSPQCPFEFFRQVNETDPDRWINIYQHIHIAIFSRVSASPGSEESKTPDWIALVQNGALFVQQTSIAKIIEVKRWNLDQVN